MNQLNPQIDEYVSRAKLWQEEMTKLRSILLEVGLAEELKWGKPCYTFQEKNIVLVVGFKAYCALIFAKGALLKDPQGVLIQPTENTQAGRQIRFTQVQEIVKLKPVLKAYLKEAIAVEKAGQEVNYKTTAEFIVPQELQTKLAKLPALKTAFAALTPGRQRGYLLYFSAPKQSQTRRSRIEKCLPLILEGKGLKDDFSRDKRQLLKRSF